MPYIHVIHQDEDAKTGKISLTPVARLSIDDPSHYALILVNAWRATTNKSGSWSLQMGSEMLPRLDVLQPVKIEDDQFLGLRSSRFGDLFVSPDGHAWTTINGIFELADEESLAKQGIDSVQMQTVLNSLEGLQPPAANSMAALISAMACADYYDPAKRSVPAAELQRGLLDLATSLSELCGPAGKFSAGSAAWCQLIETTFQVSHPFGLRNDVQPELDRLTFESCLRIAQGRLEQLIDALAPEMVDPGLKQSLDRLIVPGQPGPVTPASPPMDTSIPGPENRALDVSAEAQQRATEIGLVQVAPEPEPDFIWNF